MSPRSTSVVESVPIEVPLGAFSATVLAVRPMSDGVSLTSATRIVKAFSVKRPLASADRTRTV